MCHAYAVFSLISLCQIPLGLAAYTLSLFASLFYPLFLHYVERLRTMADLLCV